MMFECILQIGWIQQKERGKWRKKMKYLTEVESESIDDCCLYFWISFTKYPLSPIDCKLPECIEDKIRFQ